jgi:SAM-dependent methyltransferase
MAIVMSSNIPESRAVIAADLPAKAAATVKPRSRAEILGAALEIVAKYPENLRSQAMIAERVAFDIELITSRLGTAVRVCDVGAGWGTFGLTCAAVGMEAVIVDDHGDAGFRNAADVAAMEALYGEYGVQRVVRDVIADGFGFQENSFDVVTAFDVIEHLHHSPRRLLKEMVAAIRPGGLLIIGVPNCVNLRKRITVPLGFGKWSAMADWYDVDMFRGHVREPDVDDVRHIARDLGLQDVRILGRNWSGYYSSTALLRRLTPLIDRVLRLRPSLCSDIYMIGMKARK